MRNSYFFHKFRSELNVGPHWFNSTVWPKPSRHAHNQLYLGNYSPESNHGQLFRPNLAPSSWYSLYVDWAAKADSENPFNVQPQCNTCGSRDWVCQLRMLACDGKNQNQNWMQGRTVSCILSENYCMRLFSLDDVTQCFSHVVVT